MTRKLVLIIAFIFVVTGSITIFQENTEAIGVQQCVCQNLDCEDNLSEGCDQCGGEWAGYSYIMGVCDLGQCYTLYQVRCIVNNTLTFRAVYCLCAVYPCDTD